MGLTCSLLGHAFEAEGVEREREQRGDEVVTVVREMETCSRCGEQRTVSETTEVTSVLDRDDTALDAGPGAGSGGDAGGGEGREAGSASGALGSIVDRAESGDRADPPGERSDEPTHPRVDPDESYEPPESPADEDAEILGAGPDDDREPGQWPDDGEPAASPGDAVESGDTIEPGDPGDPAATPPEEGETGTPEPGTAGSSGGADAPDAAPGASGGRYVCEACGFATPAAGSSLREGDSCPECNTGWVTVENGERNP